MATGERRARPRSAPRSPARARAARRRRTVMSWSARWAGDDLGHLPPEVGQVVAGQPPVEDAAGVVDLAVPHQVHHGPHAGRRGHHASIVVRPGWVPQPGSWERSAAAGQPQAARRARARRPRRRGRRRRTTPRRRSAAGARPGAASRGRTGGRRRCPGPWRRRSSRPRPSRKKTENIEPAHWTPCGTPAADSAAAAASAIVCGDDVEPRRRPRGCSRRSVASPAAVATGFPDSVPAW